MKTYFNNLIRKEKKVEIVTYGTLHITKLYYINLMIINARKYWSNSKLIIGMYPIATVILKSLKFEPKK